MTPFVSGALGAFAVLVALAVARRLFWLSRFRAMRRGGRSFGLRRLLARLRARPEQEELIRAEAQALWADAAVLREDLSAARGELADLLSAEALDAAALSAALDKRLARLATLRERLAAGLTRIHATLDAEQRTAVAALLRSGPHGHRRHAGC